MDLLRTSSLNKACTDTGASPSDALPALDENGRGATWKAGASLRAAIAASVAGAPASVVVHDYIPSGPRLAALVEAGLINANGVPTEAVTTALFDHAAFEDFKLTVARGDEEASARYADWEGARAAAIHADAMAALADLEDEFDESSD